MDRLYSKACSTDAMFNQQYRKDKMWRMRGWIIPNGRFWWGGWILHLLQLVGQFGNVHEFVQGLSKHPPTDKSRDRRRLIITCSCKEALKINTESLTPIAGVDCPRQSGARNVTAGRC